MPLLPSVIWSQFKYALTTVLGVAIVNKQGEHIDRFDVFVQDQTSDIVDYYVCRNIRALAIASPCVIDTYTVPVISATGVLAGNYVCIQEASRAFQAKILSIAGNVLTVDTPLDYAFTTAALINERNPNLNVDGSVTRVIANLKPMPGVKWDITRMMITMIDDVVMDDAKFAGLTALTKGVVFRKSDGVHHTIFNAKTNGEIIARTSVYAYSEKAPAGVYGFNAVREFAGQNRNGVVIRLDGDNDDALEVVIQDNLTGIVRFNVIAQGHIVVD